MAGKSTPGDAVAAEIDEVLQVQVPSLDHLRRLLIDDYDPSVWGLRRLGGIQDEVVRAVASDLLLSSVEGANTALHALGLRQRQHAKLVGPHGRTMPGPETTLETSLEAVELDACATDCLRAVGSILDCLAAASVLVTGVPKPVQRAEGGWFLSRPDAKRRSLDTTPEEAAWDTLAASVAAEGNAPVAGWLAWALESRNAVVHRGQLLRMWLQTPNSKRMVRGLLSEVKTDPAYVVRVEPHMRRAPWLPDMHALTTKGAEASELWVAEPTASTLRYLREGCVRTAERLANDLANFWDSPAPSEWPVQKWALDRREEKGRVNQAAQFRGFEPDYPTPVPDQIRLHPNSAKRAQLAERVRRRLASGP